MLKNEKYKGDVLQGKTFTIDPISHKHLNNYGESDKYYMKNHYEKIINQKFLIKCKKFLNLDVVLEVVEED